MGGDKHGVKFPAKSWPEATFYAPDDTSNEVKFETPKVLAAFSGTMVSLDSQMVSAVHANSEELEMSIRDYSTGRRQPITLSRDMLGRSYNDKLKALNHPQRHEHYSMLMQELYESAK